MGCIASKDASQKSPREGQARKGSFDRRVAHVNSSRRDEGIRTKNRFDSGDVKVKLIDKKSVSSSKLYDHLIKNHQPIESQIDKKQVVNYEVAVNSHSQSERKGIEKFNVQVLSHPGMGRVINSSEAEQVAAGWPSWLASAAGEAIRGWVPRQANTFEKLEKIGQGTYSNVYKARDVTYDKIVALKKVRFDCNDSESVKFMAREILILRRLDHPNIIKLEGLITSQTSSSLYLIFEYMEHDLTGLTALPGIKFTEPQIKCYMRQLLSGLDYCHSRCVLHRDIKGSNLLINNDGILKIVDFGLASFFDPASSAQLTSRVVTLWYRAPELLLGASHYGVAVDLWSTGCILGELYTGKPILPGRTEVEQVHKILKLCGSPSEDYWKSSKLPHVSVMKTQRLYRRCVAETFKDFPASAVGLMDTLLSIDPANRGTAALALGSEFFTTKPFACDPSSLPKYPPSKEIDAKIRDREARRQGAAGGRGNRPKENVAVLPPNANPELGVSLQRRDREYSNSKREMLNAQKEHTASGFLLNPSKQTQAGRGGRGDYLEHQRKRASYSGPLVHGAGWMKAGRYINNPQVLPARSNPPRVSGLVASRTSLSEYPPEKLGASMRETVKQVGRSQRSLYGVESMRRQDQNDPTQRMAESPQTGRIKEPNLYVRGPRGNKIYVSGPLLVPSNNMEQMLKDHDRRIQEFARRRLDEAKLEKVNAQY